VVSKQQRKQRNRRRNARSPNGKPNARPPNGKPNALRRIYHYLSAVGRASLRAIAADLALPPGYVLLILSVHSPRPRSLFNPNRLGRWGVTPPPERSPIGLTDADYAAAEDPDGRLSIPLPDEIYDRATKLRHGELSVIDEDGNEFTPPEWDDTHYRRALGLGASGDQVCYDQPVRPMAGGRNREVKS